MFIQYMDSICHSNKLSGQIDVYETCIGFDNLKSI